MNRRVSAYDSAMVTQRARQEQEIVVGALEGDLYEKRKCGGSHLLEARRQLHAAKRSLYKAIDADIAAVNHLRAIEAELDYKLELRRAARARREVRIVA